MRNWKRYFEELLSVKLNVSQIVQTTLSADKDLRTSTDSIMINELQQVIKQVKNGQSSRVNYIITPEVFKYGGGWIVHKLWTICNEVFETQVTPKQFNTNIIIRVPKKGDKTLHAELQKYKSHVCSDQNIQ